MRTTSATSTGSDGSKRTKSAGGSTGEGVMNIQQKVVLSLEQQKVLSLVVAEGKNIFFTGSAGECYRSLRPCPMAGLGADNQVPVNPFSCERSSRHYGRSTPRLPMLSQ